MFISWRKGSSINEVIRSPSMTSQLPTFHPLPLSPVSPSPPTYPHVTTPSAFLTPMMTSLMDDPYKAKWIERSVLTPFLCCGCITFSVKRAIVMKSRSLKIKNSLLNPLKVRNPRENAALWKPFKDLETIRNMIWVGDKFENCSFTSRGCNVDGLHEENHLGGASGEREWNENLLLSKYPRKL